MLPGSFELDPELSRFSPERPTLGVDYVGIACRCGGAVFRVTGWPTVVSGRGGFFWRSFTRVWREARQTAVDGTRIDAHFALPMKIECRDCGRDEMLFDDDRVPIRMQTADRSAPREAYRCRDCGRGLFELVAGVTPKEVSHGADAVEVVVRCRRCRRQVRIASCARPDAERRARLDLLYGRR